MANHVNMDRLAYTLSKIFSDRYGMDVRVIVHQKDDPNIPKERLRVIDKVSA